jgi:hypothetical protein
MPVLSPTLQELLGYLQQRGDIRNISYPSHPDPLRSSGGSYDPNTKDVEIRTAKANRDVALKLGLPEDYLTKTSGDVVAWHEIVHALAESPSRSRTALRLGNQLAEDPFYRFSNAPALVPPSHWEKGQLEETEDSSAGISGGNVFGGDFRNKTKKERLNKVLSNVSKNSSLSGLRPESPFFNEDSTCMRYRLHTSLSVI